MKRKQGRPTAKAPILTRQGILNTALRLVDEKGINALSMRHLAVRLGVDPMAIYHHVPNKQALLTGLVQVVFAELEVPSAGGQSWQDQVRAVARAYQQLAHRHPNLVLYLATDIETAAGAALETTEALYQALAGAGLPPRLVLQAADLIVDYVNGFALAEVAGPLGQPGERQAMIDQLNRHAPAAFPVMRQLFASLTEAELRADFEAGLTFILAGLERFGRG
jgi:AcrR family transcriptional regulator